ncbi:hypothetical protein Dimus_001165 [Dionaea muscipula]
MAKSKKSEKPSKPVKEKAQKAKSVNVFEDISEVRSNIDVELFEGIKKLFPMSEKFSYVMPSESDSVVEIEKVSTERTVGGDEEIPEEGATEEIQTVATKTTQVSKTKSQRKNMISPAVGENEMEASDEDTQTNEATDDDTQTVKTLVVPVVSEEVKKPKRHLKKKFTDVGDETETGPVSKKASRGKLPPTKSQREEFIRSAFDEPTNLQYATPHDVSTRVGKQSVGEEEEKREEAVDTAIYTSSPTAAELNKEVDDLILGEIHHPFISDAVISLDALVQDQREEDLSRPVF